MGRETLLTLLLLLFGGLAAQPLSLLPGKSPPDEAARIAERRAWVALWLPVMPTMLAAAWLCGWALREPDPVHTRFDHGLVIAASLPFAWIALRAALRAAWALLLPDPADLPICTVGILRPRILFSPFLARALDEEQIRAAWAHEQAHVRHLDPLRIWLAQVATDLQWPWPQAPRRMQCWLRILECARDDEARELGTSGVDLAAVIVATARRLPSAAGQARPRRGAQALVALVDDPALLQLRVSRLLAPVPQGAAPAVVRRLGEPALLGIGALVLAVSLALGVVYGHALVHPFLVWTRTV